MRSQRGPLPSLVTAASVLIGTALLLAGCATQPIRTAARSGGVYDPRLGVSSSERVVADGDAVPKGGGSYLTGRPYVIGGRSYVPQQRAEGYAAVGMASWYGDAFHGRRTANGEVFDKGSVTAAHPTLPLPSYVRVTNLGNNRSMIVRVNDRGPYHGGRVMDVSQRVAETLDFRRAGTARVRVEYVGRAGLDGSDDGRLMATLRTDGAPAQLAGMESDAAPGGAVALFTPASPPPPPPAEPASRAVRAAQPRLPAEDDNVPGNYGKDTAAPIPPARPYTAGDASGFVPLPSRRGV